MIKRVQSKVSEGLRGSATTLGEQVLSNPLVCAAKTPGAQPATLLSMPRMEAVGMGQGEFGLGSFKSPKFLPGELFFDSKWGKAGQNVFFREDSEDRCDRF